MWCGVLREKLQLEEMLDPVPRTALLPSRELGCPVPAEGFAR